MTFGPHNSKQDAFQLASALIRETEALKTAMEGSLSRDTSPDDLRQFWRKCRAASNDLSNIRTLVPDIIRYAKAQHPTTYDIEAKWLAAEAAYKAIADEIEKVLPATFTTTETAAVKTALSGFPDIRS